MTGARKRKTILNRVNSTLLSLLLFCSCDGTLFHSFSSVNGEWRQGSAVDFRLAGAYPHHAVCGLQVEARTDASYLYKNLVVRADYLNTQDSLLLCDTISVQVYGNEGKRIGTTAGMLYQHQSDIFVPDISFRDSVVIHLYHLMPEDILKGVHDVGIRLKTLN